MCVEINSVIGRQVDDCNSYTVARLTRARVSQGVVGFSTHQWPLNRGWMKPDSSYTSWMHVASVMHDGLCIIFIFDDK